MINEVQNFLQDLFALKFLPTLSSNAGIGLLFVFGLLTSIHCVGMCGGIVLTQCIKRQDDETSEKKQILLPAFLYNLGRVISYTALGAVVGGLGQVVSLSGFMKGLIPLIGGIFMIIMAVNLLGILKFLRFIKIPVPKFAAKMLLNQQKYSPLVVGLLTALMPCGPIQIIEIYSLSTGSILKGAYSMLFFALGTAPALFIFGLVGSAINKKGQKVILNLSAVVVIVLGIFMMGRGLSLMGIQPTIGISDSKEYTVAEISDNIQNVRTEFGKSSFPAVSVKKGIPVKWILYADEENLNDCNNAIIIKEYGIEKSLTAGENIIEFTPTETGDFVYTCWMGMIKSKINVYE